MSTVKKKSDDLSMARRLIGGRVPSKQSTFVRIYTTLETKCADNKETTFTLEALSG